MTHYLVWDWERLRSTAIRENRWRKHESYRFLLHHHSLSCFDKLYGAHFLLVPPGFGGGRFRTIEQLL